MNIQALDDVVHKQILYNLHSVRKRIKKAKESSRYSQNVKLLLATKTVSTDKIRSVLNAGETLLGENKVQELREKALGLSTISHSKHFIGHLQTNKINTVLDYVECIQSVDRISLVQKLQNRLELLDRNIDVFIQVNTSLEHSKFGIHPDNALKFVTAIKSYDRLNIKGLMTIGLFSKDVSAIRKCFQSLKSVQINLLEKGLPVEELSMGMTNDLEIAIEEGSTVVRVGTGIFGDRLYPDSYYWNESEV